MTAPTFFGAYQVDHLLGSGGFADVYLCYHPGLETRVAVKVLHPHLARVPEVRERFLHEAQLLWRADSDRVIQVTHVDQLPDERPYFVMRHADRGSLTDLLRSNRDRTGAQHSLRQTVGLAVDLIDCLSVLKDRNLVHRDLKPSNILVKSINTADHERADRFGLPADERLLLADFGLAKRLLDGTNVMSSLGGTPAYMAPELTSLVADVGWAADMFAIGVIIFEIAAGRVPWPDKGFEHVSRVDLGAVDIDAWRDDFPVGFDDIIQRALAPEPADRYDTPAAFAAEVEGLLGRAVVVSNRATATERVGELIDELSPLVERSPMRPMIDDARSHLSGPIRIGIIGGNRLSPSPLGLKLMGQRPAPGEASLLGSVVVRMGHGSPLLQAVLHSGGRVPGTLHDNDSGGLAVRFATSPWLIESVEMTLDQPDFEGMEIIDIPHALLRRSPELVQSLYPGLDIAVVAVPADPAAEVYAIDEVLSLSPIGGPFALVGVRQIGSATAPRHATLAATVPGDDTMELKVLLGELLGGDRMDMCRANRALTIVRQVTYHGGVEGDWNRRVAELHREFPALEELSVARADLASSSFDDVGRASLHRLLGRRVASARLDADADTSISDLVSIARSTDAAWAARAGDGPYAAQVVRRSIQELGRTLNDRLERDSR